MRRACITLATREFSTSFPLFFSMSRSAAVVAVPPDIDSLPPPFIPRSSLLRPPRSPVDDALVEVPDVVGAVSVGTITSRTLASSSDVVFGNGALNIDIAMRRASSLSKSEFVLSMFDNDVTFDVVNTSYADIESTFDASILMSSGPFDLYVNPRVGSSTCIDEQPKSARRAYAGGRSRLRNAS